MAYLVLLIRGSEERIVAAGKIKSLRQQKYFIVEDSKNRENGNISFGGGTEIIDILSKGFYKVLKSEKYIVR